MPVSLNKEITLEELNNKNTFVYIGSIISNNSSRYSLIVTCSEDKEEAIENAEKSVIDLYIKPFKLTSKKKVEKLVVQYFEEFSTLA